MEYHRIAWSKAFGPIPKGFHIHHKDGDPCNNDLSNLECLSNSEHRKKHHGDLWHMERRKRFKMKYPNLTKDLKRWMEKNHKNAIDVASAIHVSPITIERLISGKTKEPIPLIADGITRLISNDKSE